MSKPTLAGIQRSLDALAAAARHSDVEQYRAALRKAHAHQATEEQTLDAYRWGRRGKGAAFFDHHANTPTPDRTDHHG